MHKKNIFLLFLFTSLLGTIFMQHIALGSTNGMIKVKVESLNVRTGPGLDFKVITQIYYGEQFPIVEKKESWTKIKINQSEGWVANWLVENLSTAQNQTLRTAGAKVTNLNVRTGPSTSFSIIDQISQETKYPIIEEEGDWIKIQLTTNKFGWIAKWLVNISENQPSLSTLETDLATVQVDLLNVRSGPSTDHSIIGILKRGDQVEVIDVNQGWYKINFEDKPGWIAGEFAAKENQTENPGENQSAEQKKVIVNTEILNLRSGPSEEHKIIGKLNKNEVLIVNKSEKDWLYVTKADDTKVIGWVSNSLVVDYSNIVSNQPTVTILNPGTNLREGPSTNFPVISIANAGDHFPILATEGDWYQIQLPDGKKAYVAGWIVSVKGLDKNIQHGIDQLLKGKVIIVDAGHGGHDYGATGLHFKSIEKELNLSIAKRLQKKLEATGAIVVMTRTSDTKISLQERVDLAAMNDADAFISIHHNTNSNVGINGTITYYYDNYDKKLALEIQNELIKRINLTDLGARYEEYFVLRENPGLAVLVELAFISNYQDELKARSEKFQENAAEGLFQGIIKYFK